MQRIAFTMKIIPGSAFEYKKRHDTIWPELATLLKGAGIEEYSIFLDEASSTLFAYLRVEDVFALDALPKNEVMQRWWAFMKDIMETETDNSPVEVPLNEVFYLP